MSTNYHAWFSEQQANLAGTSIYRRPDGSEIEVSVVAQNKDYDPRWPDARYLGEVIAPQEGGFVRIAHKSSHPIFSNGSSTLSCQRVSSQCQSITFAPSSPASSPNPPQIATPTHEMLAKRPKKNLAET